MEQTPYSKKYKLETRLEELDKSKYNIMKQVVDDILKDLGPSRFFGVTKISKLVREDERYSQFKLDTKLTNKFIIGYAIDTNPNTQWKNCGCGGTGNWRVK